MENISHIIGLLFPLIGLLSSLYLMIQIVVLTKHLSNAIAALTPTIKEEHFPPTEVLNTTDMDIIKREDVGENDLWEN